MVFFSFDHLEGSFLRSLDFHLSNSFCIWSVGYTTVKYQLNSVPLRIYIFLSTIFFNYPGSFFSKGEVPAVKHIKKSQPVWKCRFFIMSFFLCRLLEGSEMYFKRLRKDFELKIRPAMCRKKKSFNWPHCNGQWMRHHLCVKRESSKLRFVGGFISAEFQLPEDLPFSSVSEFKLVWWTIVNN